MATITADLWLSEVARSINVRLYYPTDLPKDVGCEVKGVITLLHGLGNSSADWMTMSAACRYAADNGYVLVAPSADNSFYHNMAMGPPWYTILTELLPEKLNCIFNLPAQREKNYIAGLSMGGYGALRIALSLPQRYAAVGSFSGALDLRGMAGVCAGNVPLAEVLRPVLGPQLQVPDEADLFYLLKQAAALPSAQQPRIFCSCGMQDAEVYPQNLDFKAAAEQLPLDYTFAQWDGVHEWNFWDRSLAEFIGFIQNSNYAAKKRADWGAESQS